MIYYYIPVCMSYLLCHYQFKINPTVPVPYDGVVYIFVFFFFLNWQQTVGKTMMFLICYGVFVPNKTVFGSKAFAKIYFYRFECYAIVFLKKNATLDFVKSMKSDRHDFFLIITCVIVFDSIVKLIFFCLIIPLLLVNLLINVIKTCNISTHIGSTSAPEE